MYILGIQNDLDAGAALFRDGECLFAVNEERLSRVKLAEGFPHLSIRMIFDRFGLTWDDIDVVSYAWHHRFPYEDHLLPFVERAVAIAEGGTEPKRIMLERIKVEVANSVKRRKEFEEEMDRLGQTKKVEWFDHHLGHAATAYLPSPYDEALVFTLDGLGNFRSGAVAIGRGEQLQEISCNYSWDSLGFFYGQITELLGFRYHRHEGKVTGLAAYGVPSKGLPIMQKMITVRDGKVVGLIGEYYKPFYLLHQQALVDALKPYSREDIAAAAQKHLEDVVVEYIRQYVEKYRIGTLACAGGVFANVKLNQRVRAIPGVTDLFVAPHMGDGGLAYGAGLLSARAHGFSRRPMTSAYLGNESSDGDVLRSVERHQGEVRMERLEGAALTSRVVELLNRNTVVGLFQGRMEFGPRALGNRSIIYHARDKSVNDWLNKRMRRTEFMPFAPVTTMELAPRCFVGWHPSHVTTRYMTECYDCTPEMKDNAPAVVHVDGTARPQVISREDNALYYDIVKGWYDATGGLCLINTSFNEHEHPIVCTIEDAISSMLGGNVDCIVVNGKYVISKKSM